MSVVTVDLSCIADNKFRYLFESDATMVQPIPTKALLKNLVNDLPKITGSNGNATVMVDSFNGPSTTLYVNGIIMEHRLGWAITVVGHLRDRTLEQTTKEYEMFLKSLKSHFRDPDFAVQSVSDIREI